jgi:opacity protein-like surface antigen
MRARRPLPPVLLLGALALAGGAAPAAAADVGVRGGYYFDAGEPFLGAELITPVARRIYFNPNLEWVFVENLNYLTVNADFHYDFPTRGSNFVWAGAGLGLLRVDPEGPDNSDTDPALNLLAGIGFRTGGVIPYFQAKLIVNGGSEFVLAFGVRF